MKDQQSYIPVSVNYLIFSKKVPGNTVADMKTGFHAMSYGRSEEAKNHSSMKLHATNSSFNFLGGIFSNRDNIRDPIQFRREMLPSIFKDHSF